MTEGESQAFMLEGIEGLMSLMQVLVVALGKSGQLDTGEYARLLVDYRQQHLEEDSLQATLFDRMLTLLVDQPEVLRRRMAFAVVDASPEPQPNGPVPGHAGE